MEHVTGRRHFFQKAAQPQQHASLEPGQLHTMPCNAANAWITLRCASALILCQQVSQLLSASVKAKGCYSKTGPMASAYAAHAAATVAAVTAVAAADVVATMAAAAAVAAAALAAVAAVAVAAADAAVAAPAAASAPQASPSADATAAATAASTLAPQQSLCKGS